MITISSEGYMSREKVIKLYEDMILIRELYAIRKGHKARKL